jgi:hypothetical protein
MLDETKPYTLYGDVANKTRVDVVTECKKQ